MTFQYFSNYVFPRLNDTIPDTLQKSTVYLQSKRSSSSSGDFNMLTMPIYVEYFPE